MISLVIPLYNEAQNVARLVEQITVFSPQLSDELQVILVDDGSTDHTRELLKQIVPASWIVTGYSKNRGKGYALRMGVACSTGAFVFFTDADLAYGLLPLPAMADKLKSGRYGAVVGSRRLDQAGYAAYPIGRKALSAGFWLCSKAVLGLPYSDLQCGFKGFSGDLARKVFAVCQTDRFGIDFEVLARIHTIGSAVAEYPVRVLHHNTSSVNPVRDSARTFAELLRVRRLVKGGSDRG